MHVCLCVCIRECLYGRGYLSPHVHFLGKSLRVSFALFISRNAVTQFFSLSGIQIELRSMPAMYPGLPTDGAHSGPTITLILSLRFLSSGV